MAATDADNLLSDHFDRLVAGDQTYAASVKFLSTGCIGFPMPSDDPEMTPERAHEILRGVFGNKPSLT